jgi:hypothetical protein
MAIKVVNGAKLSCPFGSAPSTFVVLPANQVQTEKQPAASVMDHVPMTNIMPFGMCNSPSNPQVTAATAAAFGVLTPQPCIPATSSPWTPGAVSVQIAKFSALDSVSTCSCQWGGVIAITDPGETSVQIP